MPQAIWNGVVLAESSKTELVEGNHYFPLETIKQEYFEESNLKTICPWKGEANYYSLVVDGKINKDAAWYYPQPKDAASNIKDHVAFWKGVTIK